MASSCTPCGRRMVGKPTAMPPGRRKEWRVHFDSGAKRDYFTEDDADTAISKYGGRKQKLSS